MTIHRIDEEIVLVSWRTGRSFGLLHVQRPRSQKGVGYCGIRIPLDRDVQRMNRLSIPDPQTFPLEIRPERDLRRLCSKCAKGFGDCVAEDYAGLEWVDVPDVWRAILTRAHRPPVSVGSKPELGVDPREPELEEESYQNYLAGDADRLTQEHNKLPGEDKAYGDPRELGEGGMA